MDHEPPDPEQGFTPPYSVEFFEVGTWFEIDNRPTLVSAMRVASAYADKHGERRVLVTDRMRRVV